MLVKESDVFWGGGCFPIRWWVQVFPGFEDGDDVRMQDVGAFFDMGGARPESICEFLSQVANGFANSPTAYFCWTCCGKLIVSNSIISAPECLEKAAAELLPDGEW